jgi:hypothetical protein
MKLSQLNGEANRTGITFATLQAASENPLHQDVRHHFFCLAFFAVYIYFDIHGAVS